MILNEFEIDNAKLDAIVTDGAANMVNAADLVRLN